jgi:hypothetical protein
MALTDTEIRKSKPAEKPCRLPSNGSPWHISGLVAQFLEM